MHSLRSIVNTLLFPVLVGTFYTGSDEVFPQLMILLSVYFHRISHFLHLYVTH